MEQEEPTLQNFAETLFTPLGNHFVTSVGMFGGTLTAPSYMKNTSGDGIYNVPNVI
jgi:hypothetical protein